MAYLNKVMLIGNIGKDPAISASAAGRKRVSFSLATSRRYRDNNGEQKEQTEWHNIVLWGKTADTFESLNITKGTSLYVEGELTNRKWTDNTGAQRSMTEINCSTFQILTPRNNANGNAQRNQPQTNYDYSQPYNQQPQQQPQQQDAFDDDLPF